MCKKLYIARIKQSYNDFPLDLYMKIPKYWNWKDMGRVRQGKHTYIIANDNLLEGL